jgi:hypothetical protein
VKQGAVAETALVTLATPGLFNDVLCKNWPREFDLLIRKVSPAGLDGLASGIKRSYEDVHGVRIKDAGLYVIIEEVAQFASSRWAKLYCPDFWGLASVSYSEPTLSGDGL